MFTTRKILGVGLGAFLTLAVISYALFALTPLLRGPRIVVTEPVNGSTVSEPFIQLSGVATGVSYIYLNDRQIFTDTAGAFRESLLLHPGYNILVLRARDRFERTTETRVELVLDAPVVLPPPTETASSTPATEAVEDLPI